jgi:hypothetical protein
MMFRSAAETFTGHKIRLLHVDNTPELVKGHFQTVCASHGITYEKTVPDSPNQNSVAKRSNLTLASMARAMLLDATFSPWFWPFAIQTAVHTKNRVPHSNLPPNITPYQLWYHEKLNLGYFCLFGSHCTSRILSNTLTKFDARGETGRFLGYANDAKGYIVWTPGPGGQAGSVKVRRDVHFHGLPLTSAGHAVEPAPNNLSLAQNNHDFTPPLDGDVDRNTSHFDFENVYVFFSSKIWNHPHLSYLSDIHPSTVVPHDSSSLSSDLEDRSHSDDHMYGSYISVTFVTSSDDIFLTDDILSPASGTTHPRPKRNICLPQKYADFVDSDSLIQQLLVLGDEELSLPLDKGLLFFSALSSVACTDALLCSLHDGDASDPSNISEAQKSKYWTEWLSAIHEELESLKSKGVYEETNTSPPGRKAVECKWVLHIKRDKDGSISCFKACLVAKGFTQIPGQDFTCTFAPVAQWDSIRSILCIAATHDYVVRQLDVKTAYLNGPLDEEIYMKAPHGFTSSSYFWRLRKGLYGLRQADRQWYLTLHDTYSALGFSQCNSDWSVYTHRTASTFSMSATSVDDIIIASDSQSESDLCARQIDCGDAEWILGCHITRCRRGS